MSSPPTSAQLVISSSPDLPSLQDILITKVPKRPPPLRSGSRAAAIPSDARTTFTSAAEVLREAPEIDIETEKITKSPARRAKTSRPRAQKARVVVDAERPTLGRIGSLGSLSPDEKPWQRYRSRGASNEGSPSPARTSTSTRPAADVASKTEIPAGSKTISKHFAKEAVPAPMELKQVHVDLPQHESLSEPEPAAAPPQPAAFARRKDWTPPRPDTVIVLDSESDNREILSSATKELDEDGTRKSVFQTLRDDYACKVEGSSLSRQQSFQVEVLGKRKLIETVSIASNDHSTSRSVSPTKPAASKRKVRTITELATAPYAPPVEPDFDITAGHTRESLLGYLDQGGDVKALFEVQTAAIEKANSTKKAPKAPPKKPRKKKAETAEAPILLSPASALKQTSNQDFVFGTSSQLIMDDSPRALRELQLAIQASNRLDGEENAADEQPGLWHAGARDEDGSLLEFRVISDAIGLEDRGSPSPRQGNDTLGEVDNKPAQIDTLMAEAESLTTEERHIATEMISAEKPPAQATVAEGSAAGKVDPTPKQKTPRKPKKPDYELLTDAQLAKKIKSFGFKAIKRRQAMISLLNQCWESQHPSNSTPGTTRAMSISASVQSPKKASPSKAAKTDTPAKRPRGRPKKVVEPEVVPPTKPRSCSPSTPKMPRSTSKSKAKKPAPIEIPDSDDILDEQLSTPSPPPAASSSDRALSASSSPPPEGLSKAEEDEADMSLALEAPTDNEEVLFRHITEAVKTTPRSTNPAEPSWHEMMLLYDPIVLEDFAVWLNSGQLTRVGWDGEVSPLEVKKWCESKSIICLWKQTQRNRERKRY